MREEISPISSDYLAWLKRHGVKWHNVKAAFVNEGWRGIIATADLESGLLSHSICFREYFVSLATSCTSIKCYDDIG